MKNLIKKILPLIFAAFFLGGCYTVVWNPSTDLPSENEEYNNNDYYPPDYYGDYYYYYGTPWWWALNRPAVSQPYERNNGTSTLRDNNGGRNSSGRDNGIINTDRPSVDSNNGSNSGNDVPRKSSSGSGSSSDSQTRSSNNRSGDNNSIRNNDGSRNSGSRR